MIQQSAAQWDRDLADRVGHEAEVTDADEVLGQDVEEKASDELIDLENHDAGRIAGFAIGPSKLDLVAVKSDQEVVGDGDPVVYRPRYFRTCSGLLGTTEGSFGVDDPSVNVKSPDPGSEPLGFG